MSGIQVTRLPSVLGGVDLADHESFAGGVPYELFARLRREAPVLFHPHGPNRADGFWVLSGYADIAAAAADPVLSAQSGGGREGGGNHLEDLPIGRPTGVVLFMMDDPRHRLIKQALHPFITGQAITSREPDLRSHAVELVDRIAEAGTTNAVDTLADPLALHVMCSLLGVAPPDRPRLAAWTRDNVGFADRRTGRVDDRSRATLDALWRYFTQFVTDRRGCPVGGLGARLADGTVPGGPPLSDPERDTHAAVLFISGFEQTRNTVAATVLAFAEHPDQWQALKADRSLLDGAVEEVLRWAPANPYNRRTATADIELHGQQIRAGDKVTLWWPSANRDAEIFDNPDRFDVRRSPNPHLAFGAGTHECLGAELSRCVLRVTLRALLDHVERFELRGPAVYAPNNKHSVLLDVPVELFKHNGRAARCRRTS